jgi:TnsA endonuclease N terminal
MAAKKVKRKKRRRGYHRGIYVSKKTGETCKYRSSWEAMYMLYLDDDPHVLAWHYEPFFIEYLSNKSTGKIRKYYPDFFVTYDDGTSQLIEIKQKRKIDSPAVKKKTAAAQGWCSTRGSTYVLLTEIELKQLGLI